MSMLALIFGKHLEKACIGICFKYTFNQKLYRGRGDQGFKQDILVGGNFFSHFGGGEWPKKREIQGFG